MPKYKQGREFEPDVTRHAVGGGTEVILLVDELSAPDIAFKILDRELDWKRIGNTPRDEYFATDINKPYTYGAGAGVRTYEPQPWHPLLRQLQQEAEFWTRLCGQPSKMDVVFLNRYKDGKDQLGWHADDSPEMDDKRPIVIITFGAEREIWFRERPSDDPMDLTERPVTKLSLPNGSICIMPPGMQDTHQHRIPRSSLNVCGPRISLTFRGYDHAAG